MSHPLTVRSGPGPFHLCMAFPHGDQDACCLCGREDTAPAEWRAIEQQAARESLDPGRRKFARALLAMPREVFTARNRSFFPCERCGRRMCEACMDATVEPGFTAHVEQLIETGEHDVDGHLLILCPGCRS